MVAWQCTNILPGAFTKLPKCVDDCHFSLYLTVATKYCLLYLKWYTQCQANHVFDLMGNMMINE